MTTVSSLATRAGLSWYLIHTRSRQEKALACDLVAMRVSHYLPLVRRVRYHGRRKAFVDSVLFPGYLFLHGTLEQAYMTDRSQRVAALIRIHDQERLRCELDSIRLALSQRAPLYPCPYLENGARVEVRSGPFRGVQGYVERRKRDRLILQVNSFGRAVSLEIDSTLLERVG